jgi:poly(3-hydroxybutyrate) depolymerase
MSRIRPHIHTLARSLCLLASLSAVPALAIDTLPPLGASPKETTVSGLSSGAFMAAQFSVIHSESISGAGIVAGGPYYCAGLGSGGGAERFMATASGQCMHPEGPAPSGEMAWKAAQMAAQKGYIDPVAHLKKQRVYIFTGAADSIVWPKVVAQTHAFYRNAGVPDAQVRYVDNVNAGHALITANPKDVPCADNAPPNLNNCGFIQSHDILQHLYGALKKPARKAEGRIVDFDQSEFVDSEDYTGLSDVGHVYIPRSCEKGGCRVHVAFHGCTQEDNRIGDRYYTTTGYNEMADTNRIIVLYPQIRTNEARNPMGCWDFWGYSSPNPSRPDFFKKSAPQSAAVFAMIQRLSAPLPTASQTAR